MNGSEDGSGGEHLVTDEAGRGLRLWVIDDSERHWLLAADEDDAWAVYQETFAEWHGDGDDMKRDDVEIRAVSEAWAKAAPFNDDDGTPLGSLYDECLRDPRRSLVASTCV